MHEMSVGEMSVQPGETAAAVVVLSFAHRWSEAMMLRIETGVREYAALASQNSAAWLIMTGGDTQRVGQTEAAYMAEVAEAEGVPGEHILCEDEARYTIENALFVRRMLERQASKTDTCVVSVTIVTSAFHMERSKLIFGAVLGREASWNVRCVPAPDGTALLEDTGQSLDAWKAAERKQLELLRSENGVEVGNILSQRIAAHEHLAIAAKQGNLGACNAWWALNAKERPGGQPDATAAVALSVDKQTLRRGSGALHYAVLYAQPAVVEWLLARGAEPNRPNANGATPLHFAFTIANDEKRRQIVDALRAAGADDALEGRSPLWSGAQSSRQLLGASETAADGTAGVAGGVVAAAASWQPRLTRLGSLLAFGDLLYAPLVEAARNGDATAVQAWIGAHHPEHSVDGPPGYSGTTALVHAASGGSAECIALLLRAGADVRLPLPPRGNALHYATFRMHRHCAEQLCLAPGADEALRAHGSSALWSSLGAVTPLELARFNAAQATEFCDLLACRSTGGVPRQRSRDTPAAGLPLMPSPSRTGSLR